MPISLTLYPSPFLTLGQSFFFSSFHNVALYFFLPQSGLLFSRSHEHHFLQSMLSLLISPCHPLGLSSQCLSTLLFLAKQRHPQLSSCRLFAHCEITHSLLATNSLPLHTIQLSSILDLIYNGSPFLSSMPVCIATSSFYDSSLSCQFSASTIGM